MSEMGILILVTLLVILFIFLRPRLTVKSESKEGKEPDQLISKEDEEYSELLREMEGLIMSYRADVKDNNRFVLNESVMADIFPEYTPDVRMKVWLESIKRKWIQQNTIDNEWQVAK